MDLEEFYIESVSNNRPQFGLLRLLNDDVDAVKHDQAIDISKWMPSNLNLETRKDHREWREVVVDELENSSELQDRVQDLPGELSYEIFPAPIYPLGDNPFSGAPIAEVIIHDSDVELKHRKEEILSLSEDIHLEDDNSRATDYLGQYHRKWGELLGYPDCDIDFFVEGYRNLDNQVPENSFLSESLNEIWPEIFSAAFGGNTNQQEFLRDPPESLYVLPTPSFYPHNSRCEKSIEMAKDVENSISSTNTLLLYRVELLYNHIRGAWAFYDENMEETKNALDDWDEDFSRSVGMLIDTAYRGGTDEVYNRLLGWYRLN
jgi:hypothetical protein